MWLRKVKLNECIVSMRESLRLFAELPVSYVVLDTETTGLPDVDGQPGIVTLGITNVQNCKIGQSFEFKLKPYRSINIEAERVHGISNEIAKTFQPFDIVWPHIKPWLDDHVVVIHNKNFDWPIIEFHVEHYKCEPPSPIKVFCSQKTAVQFAIEEGLPMSSRGPSLDNLTAYLNIEPLRKGGIHGAKIDTIQTALVVEELRKQAVK